MKIGAWVVNNTEHHFTFRRMKICHERYILTDAYVKVLMKFLSFLINIGGYRNKIFNFQEFFARV